MSNVGTGWYRKSMWLWILFMYHLILACLCEWYFQCNYWSGIDEKQKFCVWLQFRYWSMTSYIICILSVKNEDKTIPEKFPCATPKQNYQWKLKTSHHYHMFAIFSLVRSIDRPKWNDGTCIEHKKKARINCLYAVNNLINFFGSECLCHNPSN